MLSNNIKFLAQDVIIEDKNLHPIPCKLNIPDWFKKLEHKIYDKTVKGCMPFLDTLTSGYALKLVADFKVIHNMIKPNKLPKERDSFQHGA